MTNLMDNDTIMVLSNEWQANFHKSVANWDKRDLTDAGLSDDEDMQEEKEDEELRKEVENISLKELDRKVSSSDEEDDDEDTSKPTQFEIRRDQNRAEHDLLFKGLPSTPSLPSRNRSNRRNDPKTPTTGSRVSKRQSEQVKKRKKEKEQSLAASYLAAATANKKGGGGNGFRDIESTPPKGSSMN